MKYIYGGHLDSIIKKKHCTDINGGLDSKKIFTVPLQKYWNSKVNFFVFAIR